MAQKHPKSKLGSLDYQVQKGSSPGKHLSCLCFQRLTHPHQESLTGFSGKGITFLSLGNRHIQDSEGRSWSSPNRTQENANISEWLRYSPPHVLQAPSSSLLLSKAQCTLITWVPALSSSVRSYCSQGKFKMPQPWSLRICLSLLQPYWSSFSPKHSLCQKCSPFFTLPI